LRVYVRGGAGGHGLVKYGGHGGSGGNVYVVAHPNASLKRLVDVNPEKRFTASAGSPSRLVAIRILRYLCLQRN
jgi:GTPase involved in cell partitioning and DNA repair